MLIIKKETCDPVQQCVTFNTSWSTIKLYGTEAIIIDNTKNIENHHSYPLNQFLSCSNRDSRVKTSSMFPSAV